MARAEVSLGDCIDRVEGGLRYLDKATPLPTTASSWGERTKAWDRRRSALGRLLADLELRCGLARTGGGDLHAVRMAGVRSTSTSGFEGALHNWLIAARRRRAEAS